MKVTISNAKNTKLILDDIVSRVGTTFVSCQDIEEGVEDLNIYVVLERWTGPIVKVLDVGGKRFVYLPKDLVIKEVQIDSVNVSITYPL